MTENQHRLTPEETILETLKGLADETGNVEIYEQQLLDQIGEDAAQWDILQFMTSLKASGAFMGKPYFRKGDPRGSYFSVILRSEKRFPTPVESNLRYD